MAKTIAIVGAGPGIGRAVAERFGREGFNVALLARNAKALDGLVERLKAQGVNAAAFPTDAGDRANLTGALRKAMDHFGTIDVLEYSPSVGPASLRSPRNMTVENEQFQLDLALLGAIAAVEVVLPGMLERREGALLFTAPGSSLHPVSFTASRCVAEGATLNYARVLFQDLKADGIYAGIVMIAGLIVQTDRQAEVLANRDLPMITAEEAAQQHWDLYVQRDRPEAMVGDPTALLAMTRL